MIGSPEDLDVLERVRVSTWSPLAGDAGAEVRRRSDRRRHLQRVSAIGVCAVVGAAVVFPLLAGSGGTDRGQVARDPAPRQEGLGFETPAGWEIVGTPADMRTCLGPAGTEIDSCPVAVVVADDPTVPSGKGAGIVEMMDVCGPRDANLVRVTAERQGLQPTSTYTGRCNYRDSPMTMVTLDSGSAYVLTRDAEMAAQVRQIAASFDVPEAWAEPVDDTEEQPTEPVPEG